MSQPVKPGHYKDLAIQPAEYTTRNGLGHMAGDAIAYITRYKSKNGKEDLLKAIHSIELLIQFEYTEKSFVREFWTDGDIIRSKPNGKVEMLCTLATGTGWVEQDYWPQPVDERTFHPISESEARKLVEEAGGVW